MATRIFLLVIFSMISLPILAQSNSDRSTITVSSSAEVLVPADIVQFSVTISISDKDADNAFKTHKERESFLANLLGEIDIDESSITYDPIRIRPNRQRDGTVQTATQQRVNLELSDFDQLNELQKTLINNDFDNFSGRFTSSKMDEAGEKALQEAVMQARKDAELLAAAAGKAIGDVHSIDYTADRPVRAEMGLEATMRIASDSASMTDFAQNIPVRKDVRVVFTMIGK